MRDTNVREKAKKIWISKENSFHTGHCLAMSRLNETFLKVSHCREKIAAWDDAGGFQNQKSNFTHSWLISGSLNLWHAWMTENCWDCVFCKQKESYTFLLITTQEWCVLLTNITEWRSEVDWNDIDRIVFNNKYMFISWDVYKEEMWKDVNATYRWSIRWIVEETQTGAWRQLWNELLWAKGREFPVAFVTKHLKFCNSLQISSSHFIKPSQSSS